MSYRIFTDATSDLPASFAEQLHVTVLPMGFTMEEKEYFYIPGNSDMPIETFFEKMRAGVPVTTAIALQNIPEGLAVALALRSAGFTSAFAFIIAALSGLMEPVGAILGVSLASGFPVAYPIGLGLAAGAMIFVVSHEVIPQTHRNGHQTWATMGLMGGFALMMVLDTTLG